MSANVHPLSTQKSPKEVEEDTHLAHLSSGQNARRAHSRTYPPPPPIIDDLVNDQCAILGRSLRSLGVPVSLGLTRKNRRSVKFFCFCFFFSGLAVFKFGTKVVMLLMNTFCQNMTECSSGWLENSLYDHKMNKLIRKFIFANCSKQRCVRLKN